MKNRLNHNGFGLIEALIIVLIVGIIGAVGYSVLHNHSKDDTAQPAAKNETVKATSPAKSAATVKLDGDGQVTVTLTLPAGWQQISKSAYNKQQASCSATATNSLTPLAKGAAKPSALATDDVDTYGLVEYDVVAQPSTKPLSNYFLEDLYGGYDAGSHSFTDLTVGGNTAVVYDGTGGGADNSGGYKQQYYLVAHNGYVACLRWRISDSASDGTAAYDYSKYQAQVQAIAESIRFTD